VAPEPADFDARLSRAVLTWPDRFGAAPSLAGLAARGPGDPLWVRFSAELPPLPLGANDGDWALLRADLKPVLRERVTATDAERSQARCRAEGFATYLEEDAGAAPADDPGAATARLRGFHLYVSRDPDLARRAAALDTRLPAHQIMPEDPRAVAQELRDKADATAPERALQHTLEEITASDERRAAHLRAQAGAMRDLGALLGYPPCCVEAFLEVGPMTDNRGPVAAAAARTTRFEPWLNNLDLATFHTISFFPCRYDCPRALELAERVDREVLRTRALRVAALRRFARARLYVDERRQLIFDGPERTLAHARPSSAFVGGGPDPTEWIFWVQQAERGAIDLDAGVLLDFGQRVRR